MIQSNRSEHYLPCFVEVYNLTLLGLTMMKFDQQVGFGFQNRVNIKFVKSAKTWTKAYILETRATIG